MATAQEIAEMGLTPEQYNNLVMRLANRQEMASVSGPGFGVIPGETGYGFADFENPYEYVSAPLSNKGNPTTQQGLQSNQIRVLPDQPVRLYDNKTGQVVFEGVGGAGAQQAAAIAQEISNDLGNKASWKIETATPGTSDWSAVATEKENKNVIGKIADVALPVVGGILGGPLGAAAGSAASSVAQGRSIEDILLRSAIAGGTSMLIPGGPSPSPIDAAAQTVGQTAGQAAGQAVGQAATQAAGDIVVNAIVPSLLNQAIGGAAGGLASSIIPSFFDSAQLAEVPATPTQQPAIEAAPVTPQFPEEIVVTAQNQPSLLPSVGTALGSAIASTAVPALTEPTTPAAKAEQKNLLDRITGNMGLTDYLTLASLAASAGAGLFGGGGDEGTAVPYVSPFGPGMGAGGLPTGPSRQLNPTIADYERYGFGPEALFFAPQSNLVATTTTGPAGAMVNPRYEPLI